MKKILIALVTFAAASAHASEISGHIGISPFTSTYQNAGGVSLEAGVDYMRDEFRIEMLNFGLMVASYKEDNHEDLMASSAIQVALVPGLFGGLRAGVQFLKLPEGSTQEKVKSFGALTLTAIAPMGLIMTADVGLSAVSRYTKFSFGYHF